MLGKVRRVVGVWEFGKEKWDWKPGWNMVFGNAIWSEHDAYVVLSKVFDL